MCPLARFLPDLRAVGWGTRPDTNRDDMYLSYVYGWIHGERCMYVWGRERDWVPPTRARWGDNIERAVPDDDGIEIDRWTGNYINKS